MRTCGTRLLLVIAAALPLAATLRVSNLGGLGGRCKTNASKWGCEHTNETRAEVYLAGVGRHGGSAVDLQITNLTEYRAWNADINGIQSVEAGQAFGVVNLLAPRSPTQAKHWHARTTFVRLRFSFLNGDGSRAPRSRGRPLVRRARHARRAAARTV